MFKKKKEGEREQRKDYIMHIKSNWFKETHTFKKYTLVIRQPQDDTLKDSRDTGKMNCVHIFQLLREYESNYIFIDISKFFTSDFLNHCYLLFSYFFPSP